ncbi:hypothetical protein LZ31DRAFT_554339 [Colletotrichum somersetense]|nr:hypothetical protein LZ31DRAFT_554339 [Colletotrichum somersetense]
MPEHRSRPGRPCACNWRRVLMPAIVIFLLEGGGKNRSLGPGSAADLILLCPASSNAAPIPSLFSRRISAHQWSS